MSFDNMEASVAMAPEAENTTNGAPSGVQDILLSWIPTLVEHGRLPLQRLNDLSMHAFACERDMLCESFRTIFADYDSPTIDTIIDYYFAKRAGDFVKIAHYTKTLAENRGSPFCVLPSKLHAALPPTTRNEPFGATPSHLLNNRSKAATRATQIIQQFQLDKFDASTDAVRYLEWKFAVLDACDLTENDYFVRLEILLHCLVPSTCSDVRLNLAADYAANSDQPQEIFELTMRYMDKRYKNLRSVRHIEQQYLGIRMGPNEKLTDFHSRFQRSARLYERARDSRLSDSDRIVAFGNSVLSKYDVLLKLVETTGLYSDFAEYTQKVLYLADSAIPPAQIDVDPIGIKRPRTDGDGTPGGNRRGFGCFRCCEGNHIALNCPNSVKDLKSRCARCGNRRHDVSKCPQQLSRPCRRCNGSHFESVCPNDIKRTQPSQHNNIDVDSFDALQTILSGETVDNFVLEIVAVDCQTLSTGVVDLEPPTESASIGNTALSGLIDTGAGASIMHPSIVVQLRRDGSIVPSDVTRLDPPVRIRFGNGQLGQTDMSLSIDIRIRNEIHKCVFLIYNQISPALIFGRPLLRSIGMLPRTNPPALEPIPIQTVQCNGCQVSPRPPWVTETELDGQKHLMIRFPLMENLCLEPIREPLRTMSETNERIILQRLLRMQSEKSVRESTLSDCPIIVPIVLVDKKDGVPRKWDDPQIHDRYRLTSDLRGYNRARILLNGNDIPILSSYLLKDIPEQKVLAVDQFQHSALICMAKFPIDRLRYFSKVDISNAYNAVQIPPTMQHIGAEIYDRDQGIYRYFLFTTLMQGWRYSPLFFRMVAEYITRIWRQRSTTEEVHIAFYQDDILLGCGPQHREALFAATTTLVAILAEFAFRVRPDKIHIAVDSINFCGYALSDGRCVPQPTRRKFTTELTRNLWTEFIEGYKSGEAHITKWVQSVCGMFQYLYGFLDPASLESLRKLYALLPRIKNADDAIAIEDFKQPFDTLVEYVTNGIPSLWLGSFGADVECSIIITDANKDSWAGMLLKAIRVADTRHYTDVIELSHLCEKLNLTSGKYAFAPVRVFGGRFNITTQRQSSTYRERVAQLECVSEAYSLIEGKCYLVADNQNCIQKWHDLELFGSNIGKWQTLCSLDCTMLWMPRDSLPSLTDLIARVIGKDKDANEDSTRIDEADDACSVDVLDLSVVPGNMLSQIVSGYTVDRESTYLGVPLYRIYQHMHETTNDEKLEKILRYFVLNEDGLMFFVSGNMTRPYIPNTQWIDQTGKTLNLRTTIIDKSHRPCDMHVGIFRTYKSCSKFFWPQMSRDVNAFVSSCWVCIKEKTRLVKSHQTGILSSTSKFSPAPFRTWFVDHLGPLPMTTGPRFVLVAVCGYSHYCWCVPVDSVDALTTGTELFKLFCLFGIPSALHTDRGSGFLNDLNAQLCALFRIDHQFSPAAFPRANGLAEQQVGSIKNLLKTMHPSNLSLALPLIVLLHNTTPSSRISTHASYPLCPFEGAFGITPKTISDFGTDLLCTSPFTAELQYYTRRMFQLGLAESLETMEHQSQVNSSLPRFKPGDIVIIIRKKDLQSTKVDGPYVLLSRIGSSIWRMYRLEGGLMISITEAPEAIMKEVHTDDIIEGLDIKAPIPKIDPTMLTKNQFIIAKICQEPITLSLFKVITNDVAERKLVARLWKANRLCEFFETERSSIIIYDDIVIGGFKLANRMISESIQNVLLSILRGGL